MAHTPAPWLRESQINSEGSDWIIVTKDYEEIVDLRLGDGHVVSEDAQEANVRLIAAAPDLLAAARLANQELIDLGVGSSGSPALRALWSAIAKAERRE